MSNSIPEEDRVKSSNDDEPQSDTAQSDPMHDELNTILPGNEPLDKLHVDHQGGLEYTVMSVSSDEPTYYYIRLDEKPKCTCPDSKYNKSDGEHTVCKHIAAAMLTPRMSMEETMGQVALNLMTRLNDAVNDAEAAASSMEEARINQLSNTPETEQASSDDSPPSGGGDRSGIDPVSDAKALVRDLGGDPDSECDVKIHDEYDSLNIDLTEHVDWWGDMMDVVDDCEDAWFDSDSKTFIVLPDGFEEVLQ